MAVFPYAGAFFLRFVLFFDKIVALSLLPILFIVFGIDEWSKIMLMVIGVAPTLMLDTYNIARSVPREQIVKAFTLKSTNLDVAYRVVLKQVMPQIINSVRLNLKPLALFLFAGEMIASTDGLAYRIAIMRRHMGMDIILPYLLWVALLLFLRGRVCFALPTGGCIRGISRSKARADRALAAAADAAARRSHCAMSRCLSGVGNRREDCSLEYQS